MAFCFDDASISGLIVLVLYKQGFAMRTLNISISDIEYNKFGLKNEQLSFSEFIELVSNELARQNLIKSVELAEKYGLSSLTMADITNEVRTVRNAKNNS